MMVNHQTSNQKREQKNTNQINFYLHFHFHFHSFVFFFIFPSPICSVSFELTFHILKLRGSILWSSFHSFLVRCSITRSHLPFTQIQYKILYFSGNARFYCFPFTAHCYRQVITVEKKWKKNQRIFWGTWCTSSKRIVM